MNLYLNDGTSSKKMPVPNYFWKVVRDPSTDQAVAFVGVNNVYLDDSEADEVQGNFCQENVCEKIDFLGVKSFNASKGILFCCNVDEFRETVSYLPEFPVEGLLMT